MEKGIEDILKDFVLRPEEFMFFLGAGFSKEIGLPSEQELAESLAKKYGEEKIQGALDDVIASLLKKKVDREEICKAIKEEFNKREAAIEEEFKRNEYNFLGIFFRIINQVARKLERENSPHQVIIATTNWDDTMKFFEKKFKRKILSIYSENQVKSREMVGRRIIVYHLHGSIEDCNSMILTKEEKSRVSEDTEPWHSFTADVDKHRVIFIGYSMADEDILNIYIKSRKNVGELKDYIIVNDDESKERIERKLKENKLENIATVIIINSLKFLEELARSMGLSLVTEKVELETEKRINEKLGKKRVIVTGYPASGLTTLYLNYLDKLPEKKLHLDEYKYEEDKKRAFDEVLDHLINNGEAAIIAPEYLYEIYLDSYLKSRNYSKDVIDKLHDEIRVKHYVSKNSAINFLEKLVNDSNYKDKYDEDLENMILELVKQEVKEGFVSRRIENYPLKLLKDVFQDVNKKIAEMVTAKMREKDIIKNIKKTLKEKIDFKDEFEKIVDTAVVSSIVSTGIEAVYSFDSAPKDFQDFINKLIKIQVPIKSIFFDVVKAAIPFAFIGIVIYEISEFVRNLREGRSPVEAFVRFKKYWDSLTDSERRVLCYKLDMKNHLWPGKSEEFLNNMFTDKNWSNLKNEIDKIKDYVNQNLEEFRKKLDNFEKKYGKIMDEISKINEDIRFINDKIKSISEELQELKKRIEELRERVNKLEEKLRANDVDVADKKDFEKGFSNIKVENDKLRISVRPREFKGVVMVGEFGRLIDDVADTLKELGVVVVTGPKGIGKSILGTTVAWKLLNSSSAKWVIGVKDLSNDNVVANFNNFLLSVKELGHRSLVVFDPSATYAYMEVSGERDVPKKIKTTLENLLNSIKPGEQEMLLIILPAEMYKPVNQLIRKKLSESIEDIDKVIKEIRLNDKEFLAGVIREYLGECQIGDEKLSELAGKVADFDSGYTLIARLVGEELARNCNVDKINELIDKSRGKAEEFILGHINSFFKVNNDNRVRALIEIFALRRPFVDMQSAESPILTPGIIEIIRSANDPERMEQEMINWLVYRHHDLIEDTIERLLDGEDLGRASKPWKRFVISTNVTEITEEVEAVEYFIENEKYGEEFFEELSNFSGCWKRAALIIGYMFTRDLKLPDKEEVPSDSAVVDVLNPCDIDDYLLVDNEIPEFVAIMPLYLSSSSPFTRIFTNEYENAIKEAKKLLEIWRKREKDEINTFEAYYALGLALIVAEAARLGKTINEDDADAILKAVTTSALTIYPTDIKLILEALEPLRDEAPQQYLEILAEASQMELDKDTARLIYDELNHIPSNFFISLSKLVWSLVTSVRVYSEILYYSNYFTKEEVENIVKSMCNLLNALKKESNELAIIAEAFTLIPALEYSKIRNFMSEYCPVKDLITRAVEIRENLKELASKSDELLKNEYFMNWSIFVTGISQQDIRKMITDTEAVLTYALAKYKFYNDEFDEASKLFNEAAEALRSVKDWKNYIVARVWFLRAEVIKARSINEYVNVASNFEKLWNETLENLAYTAYLYVASVVLGSYLVYLASIGRYDDIEKIRNKHAYLLYYDEQVSVLTRLMLRLLGFTKVAEVKPKELIDAYEDDIYPQLLPALKLTLDIEASIEECESLKALKDRDICRYAFLAVKGNNDALTMLRSSLNVELLKLVQGLDGKALVQLLASMTLDCHFALMLYALVNGNAELVKKHAQRGSEAFRGLLVGKLFGDVYEACCDVSSEGFKLALLKLYYFHV